MIVDVLRLLWAYLMKYDGMYVVRKGDDMMISV